MRLIALFFTMLAVLSEPAGAQTFYANSVIDFPVSNQTLMLDVSNCNTSLINTCPPTNNIGQLPENQYTDMALDLNGHFYYVSSWGSLYERDNNDASTCRFLGSFGVTINALVADINGIIYAAGNNGGTCYLYKYDPSTGIFSTVGPFPPDYFSAGDLFFYEEKLFLTATDAVLNQTYLVQVNIDNPLLSCYYMDLQNMQIYGAFSINYPTYSKAYILNTVFVGAGNYQSTLYEIDLSARTIGPALCSYPYEIYGAASMYHYTTGGGPSSSISITSSAGHICYGTPVTFNAIVTNCGPSPYYQWTKNGVNVGIDSTLYTDSTLHDGDIIQCLLATGYSCMVSSRDSSNTIAISVSPLVTPSVAITSNGSSICPGAPILFTASATNGGTQTVYQWKKNGQGVGLNNNTYSDSGFLNGDSISCTIISNASCLAVSSATSNVLTVTVYKNPVVSLPPAEVLCNGSSRQLDAGNFSSWLWGDGSTGRILTVTDTGTYYVTVTDNNGCRANDTVTVTRKECGVYIPGAFSPNSDGRNDFFRPLVFGNVSQYRFQVYNRWGNLVFQTTDVLKGWDGTIGDSRQDPGIYAWICTYRLEGSAEETKKGTVMLVR